MVTDDTLRRSWSALRREQTLAVVLGVSEWPHCPDFNPAASFRHSAHGIADYLCISPDGPNLPKANTQVLIDAFEDAPEILRRVRHFIRGRREELRARKTPATDLLIYYVGHGGFGERDTFFLSVRATDEDDPMGTSITADSLGRLIREEALRLRTYIVLDCCFAASVMRVFMSGGGPLGVAGVKVQDALPPQGDPAGETGAIPEYGTALLCASGPREPARAPPDLPYTMFTGGLLAVLAEGDAEAPPWLSIDDLQRLVRTRLAAQFGDKAVLPQVYAPQQRAGRVDLVPLFRNKARDTQAQAVSPVESMPGTLPAELVQSLLAVADRLGEKPYMQLRRICQGKIKKYIRNEFFDTELRILRDRALIDIPEGVSSIPRSGPDLRVFLEPTRLGRDVVRAKEASRRSRDDDPV